MIAGTGFRIVDVDYVWPACLERARRSRLDDESLEAIRRECVDGRAVCVACEDGIVVMAARMGETSGLRVKVLLAASDGRVGALMRREDEVVAIARDMGAVALEFETERATAWKRLLGDRWVSDGNRFWRAI